MRFVWDEYKDRTNLAKHGISFRRRAKVFDDPRVFSFPDGVVEGDQRWKSIGFMTKATIILPSGDAIRYDTAERARHRGGTAALKVQRLALPTYIRGLLHETLLREGKLVPARARKAERMRRDWQRKL